MYVVKVFKSPSKVFVNEIVDYEDRIKGVKNPLIGFRLQGIVHAYKYKAFYSLNISTIL